MKLFNNGEMKSFLGKNYSQTSWAGRLDGAPVWECAYSPNLSIAPHHHETAYICFVFLGDVAEHDGKQERIFNDFRASYQPPGSVHAWRVGPHGARLFGFAIDDALLASPFGVCAAPSHYIELPDRRFHNYLHAAMRAAHGVESDTLFNTHWRHEILATLIRDEDEFCPKWFADVRAYIHDHYADNPTPVRLGEVAQRHPAHVMRAFKQQSGVTIGRYIKFVQVEAACRRLREMKRSCADIAQDCGFSDQSHMTRVFRAIIGATPKAYQDAFL